MYVNVHFLSNFNSFKTQTAHSGYIRLNKLHLITIFFFPVVPHPIAGHGLLIL